MVRNESLTPNETRSFASKSAMSSRQLPVPVDSLLDAFIALYYDCKNLSNPPQNVSNFMLKCKLIFSGLDTRAQRYFGLAHSLPNYIDKAAVTRLELHRKSKSDLAILKTLATGSVGRVTSFLRFDGTRIKLLA